jgi:hypothetical protein
MQFTFSSGGGQVSAGWTGNGLMIGRRQNSQDSHDDNDGHADGQFRLNIELQLRGGLFKDLCLRFFRLKGAV